MTDEEFAKFGWYESIIPKPTPAEILAAPKFALDWSTGEVKRLTPTEPPTTPPPGSRPRLVK